MKHEILIYVQKITDAEVNLGMLEFYEKVRIQMSQMSQKLVYDKTRINSIQTMTCGI